MEVLKSFSEHHDYDGLVVLLSITGKLHHPRQQVAVYSNNTDILNQVKEMQKNQPDMINISKYKTYSIDTIAL